MGLTVHLLGKKNQKSNSPKSKLELAEKTSMWQIKNAWLISIALHLWWELEEARSLNSTT